MKYKKYEFTSKFKVFVLIIIFTLTMSLTSIQTFALTIPIVSSDKQWTITFNKELDFSYSNLYNNINIYDEYDNEIGINIIKKDAKSIIIKPFDDYEQGKLYVLEIDKNLKSSDNKTMNKSVQKVFRIEGKIELSTIDIVKQNINKIVYIKVYNQGEEYYSYGSGFIVDANGIIVTNYHVIDDANSVDSITVETYDGKIYEVEKILSENEYRDIVILKLKNASNLPFVTLGDSDEIELGEECVTIGNPQGYKFSIGSGIISGFRDSQGRLLGNDIQYTAETSGGSSGGALFNRYGEVIGVTYASHNKDANIHFAISVNEVRDELRWAWD